MMRPAFNVIEDFGRIPVRLKGAAVALVIPDNLSLLTLPPYSPDSPSASSIPTKSSSRPAAKHGTTSPTNRKSSPQ